MKVLIVEDVQNMRQVIKKIVQSLGIHTIDEACNGMQALNYLTKNKYNLVITDWIMPKISGIELAQYIKKSRATKDTLVIMLTGQSSKEDLSEAIKCGVDGYLIKPISPLKLKNQLQKVLKIKEIKGNNNIASN